MKRIFETINNLLVGGATVLFIAFNGMFYSVFDKNDKVSIYALLIISMIFYFIILIIYAVLKKNNASNTIEELKVLEIIENDSGIHLILKQNETLTLNTVCSIYCVEKNGYENFAGLGYVYNIAKDNKIDIKMIECIVERFVVDNAKNKKSVIIKKDLNYENIQIVRR